MNTYTDWQEKFDAIPDVANPPVVKGFYYFKPEDNLRVEFTDDSRWNPTNIVRINIYNELLHPRRPAWVATNKPGWKQKFNEKLAQVKIDVQRMEVEREEKRKAIAAQNVQQEQDKQEFLKLIDAKTPYESFKGKQLVSFSTWDVNNKFEVPLRKLSVAKQIELYKLVDDFIENNKRG